MPTGTRLPSQRELVRRCKVSASTVAQAIALLAQEGLVESRPGDGAYRSAPPVAASIQDSLWQREALDPATTDTSSGRIVRRFDSTALDGTLGQFGGDVVDLNGGYLHPSLAPTSLLRTALSRVSRREEAWERPPAAGIPALRDWFAREIAPGLARSDILVVPGGQAALATALRALACPGEPIIVEAPTYPGTLAAAAAAALRVIPLPLDDFGMVPEALGEALARTGARVVVVQPLFQNPTGTTMTVERRRRIRAVAREHGAFVVEDDFARYLAHTGSRAEPPMIAEDESGTVVHIRSLTKPTSPNLRIAALASRGPVTARLREAATADSLIVPALLQHTALDVVTSSGWKRARRELGDLLAQRRRLVLQLLSAAGSRIDVEGTSLGSAGGYHLWVRVPPLDDSVSVDQAALAAGVAVTPGGNYHPSGHTEASHVRLSCAAAPNGAELERGVRRLIDLFDGV